MATDPTSRPITTLLLQGCVWPPYWSAKMYEMIKAIIKNAPMRSICNSFSLSVAWAGFALAGILKKKRVMIAARPPMGRLT